MRVLTVCLGVSVARLFQPGMQVVSYQAFPKSSMVQQGVLTGYDSFRSTRAVHERYPASDGVPYGSVRVLLFGFFAGLTASLSRKMSCSLPMPAAPHRGRARPLFM